MKPYSANCVAFFYFCVKSNILNSSSSILPILFFPPIEFFFHLLNSKEVSFELFETYPKQTYRNRCTILSANGLLDLSIAVNKPNGKHTITKDIIIFNQDDWKNKFRRSIEAAYNSSPYFMFYKDDIMDIFMNKEELLYKFNLNLIKNICNILDIELKFKLTDIYRKDCKSTTDLRDHFNPKKKTTKFHFPEYTQVFSEKFGFKPNLSIIDLLFNLGPESRLYLQNCKMHNA